MDDYTGLSKRDLEILRPLQENIKALLVEREALLKRVKDLEDEIEYTRGIAQERDTLQ